MTVRTFTMPKSLNESLANSQPPVSDADRASPQSTQQQFSPSQKAPLANHGVKERPGITFAAQEKLAKLPIPELDSTLEKYKAVLKPLQSRREQADTSVAADEFLKGEGAELHSRLKKYATGKTSYIEQFCMTAHFLLADAGKTDLVIQGTIRI